VAAKVQQINVASSVELENTILSYIAQGFVVSNRTTDKVTLFKKKEFNVVWAIIGFFLCLIPLLVYCIVYASQSDEMIVITVGTGAVAGQLGGEGVTWSDDRQWWWDGTKWRDASAEMPPNVRLSEDEQSWWDGKAWRPVQSGPSESQAAPASPPELPASASLPSPPPGTGESWLTDPSGRHPDRYWDGAAWTRWVRDKPGGTRSEDAPVPASAARVSDADSAPPDGDSARESS